MKQYTEFAQLYDTLMDDVDYNAWAADLLRLSGANSGQPVRAVDIACGTGNITLRLAQMGWQLTGVDVSEAMLRLAQEKAQKAGLFIPFVRQDMRSLLLHRPVDVAICACDGVNYLTAPSDVASFFKAVHTQLKPGGRLLFDIRAPWALREMDGQFYGEDRGDVAYLWQNRMDDSGRVLEMDLTFFAQASGGLYRRFQELHRMAVYEIDEICALLDEHGFDAQVYAFAKTTPPAGDEVRIQFAATRR